MSALIPAIHISESVSCHSSEDMGPCDHSRCSHAYCIIHPTARICLQRLDARKRMAYHLNNGCSCGESTDMTYLSYSVPSGRYQYMHYYNNNSMGIVTKRIDVTLGHWLTTPEKAADNWLLMKDKLEARTVYLSSNNRHITSTTGHLVTDNIFPTKLQGTILSLYDLCRRSVWMNNLNVSALPWNVLADVTGDPQTKCR
jgi:hypothetical protein